MIADESNANGPKVRAPSGDRSAICLPAAATLSELTRGQFHRRLNVMDVGDLSGSSFVQLARDELSRVAAKSAGSMTSWDVADLANRPIILTGHQPELFHAGVWFKDYLMAHVAEAVGAVGIHLSIDNDLCHTPAIQLPTGSREQPKLVSVPFDRATVAIPYEDRRVLDPTLFASFAERVTSMLAPLIADPLVAHRWTEAVDASRAGKSLSESLSAMRHAVEHELALRIVEVPLSAVCDGDAFLGFVAHAMQHASDWHGVYNEELLEFRREHRIRSQAHPVPQLIKHEDWIELPFWMWTASDPRRRRLAVSARQGQLWLSSIGEPNADGYELGRWDSHHGIVAALREHRTRGVKVRPRALMTTFYARLFLSDLFVHGIGGGAYDQLTDRLIERLARQTPPAYAITTATLRLPIDHERISADLPAELNQRLRHLRFHPERFLTEDALRRSEVQDWVASKRAWIARGDEAGRLKQRHDAIERANVALRAWVEPAAQELKRSRNEAQSSLRRQRLLDSRTFSYGLFPEKMIVNSLQQCLIGLF